MIFNGVITSLTIFIALKFDVLQSLASWGQGDFSTIISGKYELLYISIPALIIIYFFCNRFIIASFGKDFATNLGLNYKNTLLIGLLLVSIIIGIINVNIGAIPFLGLIVPNLISLYLGDNIKKVLLYNTIVGAFFILICDIIGRLIIYPYEIPVSMITGIIGSLMFLFLVIRKK